MQARRGQRHISTNSRIDLDSKSSRDAGLWAWDGGITLKDGRKAETLRQLPETLARQSHDNGARLVFCVDGVEGEIWREGILTASRWWPTTPGDAEWVLFLRAGKYPATPSELDVPTPVSVPWRSDLPFIDRDPDNLQRTFSAVNIALIAASLLLFILSIQAGQYFVHTQKIAQTKLRLEQVTRDNQDAYRARAAALSSRSAIASKAGIGNPAMSLQVIQSLALILKEPDADIINIQLADENLTVTASFSETPDLIALTRAFESIPFLTDIYTEPVSGGRLTIKARVLDVAPDTIMPEALKLPTVEELDDADMGDDTNSSPDGGGQAEPVVQTPLPNTPPQGARQ